MPVLAGPGEEHDQQASAGDDAADKSQGEEAAFHGRSVWVSLGGRARVAREDRAYGGGASDADGGRRATSRADPFTP